MPVLIAPEAREARRRPQLVGPGLLRARDREGALEMRFGVRRRTTAGENDLALQTMQLGIRGQLPRLLGDLETLLDSAARLGEPPGGQERLADGREHSRYAAAGSQSASTPGR